MSRVKGYSGGTAAGFFRRGRCYAAFAFFVALSLSMAGTARSGGLSGQVVEDRYVYHAVKGDYLLKIAGMHGVDLDYLLKQNPQQSKYVKIGERFVIDRRTIVPEVIDNGVLVNIPDRMLYIFEDGELKGHFPVGLGKPDWETPRGRFKIILKEKDPTWYVPKKIQAEMAASGEKVMETMPPGPDNPLGRWALKTSIPGILIHETSHPESVYRFRSHGCMRMKGVDAWIMYNVLDVGTEGVITYIPVKLAQTPEGRVFLEVQKDVYGLGGDPLMTAVGLIERNRLDGRVDWEKVAEVVDKKSGIATDVTSRTRVTTARRAAQPGGRFPAINPSHAVGVIYREDSL